MNYGGDQYKEPMWKPLWPLVLVVIIMAGMIAVYIYGAM